MALAKEAKRVVREAERQGFRVKETKMGWMIYAKEGPEQVLMHKTPSDWRALRNDIARLRRIGFEWKGR
jgi:hypothetical protein